MNKLLSIFQGKISKTKNQFSDFVFKERTLNVSDKLINEALEADETFSRKLSEKGLSKIHLQVEQDKFTVTGVLNKHIKDAGFTVELRPEKIVWTKDEQVIFMEMLDYDLQMRQGGYLNLLKLTIIKLFMALFSQETVLKKANIEVQDGLIKIDLKDAGENSRRILRSIELREIQCLPGSFSITIKPREDMAKENMSLLKNWIMGFRE